MKILATTPVNDHIDIAKHAISTYGCDTYIISNNKYLDIKADLVNDPTEWCNGAWNQAMKYFLEGDWTHLALGTSDVIMKEDWKSFIPFREKEVWVPTYANSLEKLPDTIGEERLLAGGVAGAFTILPREAVEIVYPIPSKLKLWFGDEYIFDKLKRHGWKVMQYAGCAYHYGSISIASNQHEALKVIEEDKIAWANLPAEVWK
jgi:hypothetical protein